MNKETIKLLGQDYTYITDCWKKFVELTPTETKNLKQMALNQRQKNVNRPDCNLYTPPTALSSHFPRTGGR